LAEIKIRHVEPTDAPAVSDIYNCPTVITGTLQLPFRPAKLWLDRIANQGDRSTSLVAEIEGLVVGHLGFHPCANSRRLHVGSFGMGVSEEYQGKGVGSALLTALFELTDNWLNIKRIEIEVFTDNIAGIALYKKFGFITEGESKMFAFRNGRYADVFHMARFSPNNK
jgi:putative acetyltransferase